MAVLRKPISLNETLEDVVEELQNIKNVLSGDVFDVITREVMASYGYYGIEWDIDTLMILVRAWQFNMFAIGDYIVDNDIIWEIAAKNPWSYYVMKDSSKENLTPHIVLSPRDVLPTRYAYNSTATNTGGYAASLMPTNMETEYEKLGSKLKSYIRTIRRLENNKGNWAWAERRMYLPSNMELLGHGGWANNEGYGNGSPAQLQLYVGGGIHRIKSIWTWTADPSSYNTSNFCTLDDRGHSNDPSATSSEGVAPLITLA